MNFFRNLSFFFSDEWFIFIGTLETGAAAEGSDETPRPGLASIARVSAAMQSLSGFVRASFPPPPPHPLSSVSCSNPLVVVHSKVTQQAVCL